MVATSKPQIVARFETDAQGRPKFVKDGDTKHYNVTIEVENLPSDVYAATFELHESYYDPVQTLRPDKHGRLSLKTTSYGDYDLKVRLRTREGEILLANTLARALQRGRSEMPLDPAVDRAIVDIADN